MSKHGATLCINYSLQKWSLTDLWVLIITINCLKENRIKCSGTILLWYSKLSCWLRFMWNISNQILEGVTREWFSMGFGVWLSQPPLMSHFAKVTIRTCASILRTFYLLSFKNIIVKLHIHHKGVDKYIFYCFGDECCP